MHGRAPAPNHQQRVQKQKSHTVTLKKFRSLEKMFRLSANQSYNGLTSPEQNAQDEAGVKPGASQATGIVIWLRLRWLKLHGPNHTECTECAPCRKIVFHRLCFLKIKY